LRKSQRNNEKRNAYLRAPLAGRMASLSGVYTALVTPTVGRGEIDWASYRELLDFQADAGVRGVVIGGTTGESPTLRRPELERLLTEATARLPGRVEVIAGTGRNDLAETLEASRFAVDHGIRTVLLVDPYYNGPSSLEIRREYLEPLADTFPELGLLPYVIPARTGTRLEPVDLARLGRDGRRLAGVKDATGEVEYGREVRRRCPELPILSGDDARTLAMMEDPAIRAQGVISVVSNLLPRTVVELVEAASSGSWERARRIAETLAPLAESVTLKVREPTGDGDWVSVRSRNPVPIKSAMALLGARVGGCRPPLGRLSPGGLAALRSAVAATADRAPESLRPFEERFGVDVRARLGDAAAPGGLAYDRY
jgi:4-hydroxy-tetrahydrodipicolinate synthase